MSLSATTDSLRRFARAPITDSIARRRLGLAFAAASIAALYTLLAHDLFTNLGGYWLRDFDESRHIANAMEMLHRGDWLVNTYRGSADYWNLKPPASFWAIMLSVQVFGASAFAVRLPSALATLLCCAICTAVAWRWRGPLAAVITTAAFGSSLHLIDLHSGRTADPDALFVLFMTSSVLSAAWSPRRPWLLVAATTFASMAFLTKSYHAALALVFLAGVVVITRRSSAVRARHLLAALAGFLPVIAWAFARYQHDGVAFFKAMVMTDVVARSESQIEGHTGGSDYYLTNIQVTFGPWVLVLGLALVGLLGSMSWASVRRTLTRSEGARTFLALGVWVALVFAAFSVAASKLPWYTIPALPTLTLLIGVGVAAVLPRIARPTAILVLGSCLVAIWLGQVSIMQQRQMEQPTSVQLALSQLAHGQLEPGQHIYVDPVLSGWQQSLVALVDMNSTAVMMDGFDSAWRTDPSHVPTILVQEGSPAYVSVMKERPKVLVSYLDWKIVERTAAPSA